jgi:hypothetical protein
MGAPPTQLQMSLFTTQEALDLRKVRLEKATPRYKFQSVKYLADLSNNELYISDPEKFNDPFDLKLSFEDETDRGPFTNEDKLRQALGSLFEDNPELDISWFYDKELLDTMGHWIAGHANSRQVIDAVKKRSRAFGVACFAQDWSIPLMWSHYGASHAGMCVEYAVNPMKFALAPENLVFSQHYVQYTTQLPTIALTELLFSPHQVLPRMVATKHADWAYEKEWRLIHFTKKGGPVAMPKQMEITALIAGLGVSNDDMKAIAEKAGALGVAAMRVRQDMGYDLKLAPL